mgnify:CR=1 FL=1
MSQDFLKNSLLFSTNIIFIEELYQKFIQDPSTIDSSWVKFFTENSDEVKSVLADYYGPSWAKRNLQIINSIILCRIYTNNFFIHSESAEI